MCRCWVPSTYRRSHRSVRRQVGHRTAQSSRPDRDIALSFRPRRRNHRVYSILRSPVIHKELRCIPCRYRNTCLLRYMILRFYMGPSRVEGTVRVVLKFLDRRALELIFVMALALPLLNDVSLSEGQC